MDDRPFSPPLTIKSRPGPVREISDQLSCKGSSLTPRLSLPISQSRFSLPTLAGSPGETRQNKGNQNETAIKHMDRTDGRFSVVRADYPGWTDSVEE
jgi:hypothetical protein